MIEFGPLPFHWEARDVRREVAHGLLLFLIEFIAVSAFWMWWAPWAALGSAVVFWLLWGLQYSFRLTIALLWFQYHYPRVVARDEARMAAVNARFVRLWFPPEERPM